MKTEIKPFKKIRKVKSFNDEVKFQVGQRVHVELKEIPEHERNCTTGVIRKIDTMYYNTPEMRKFRYTVRFDEKYIKKEFVWVENIHEITVPEDYLKLIKDENSSKKL